jgi:hypothetical protein
MSRQKPRRARRFPPHANAETHAVVMRWLRTATTGEIMAVSVKAGVYTSDGELTPEYGWKRTV